MHALRKYVQTQMDARGWRPADLANASGISKQVVSGLLADTRDHIDRMPSEKTITGLCRAFSIQRPVLLAVIGEAMGLPMDRPVKVADASRVSNDELIRELARRLGEAGGEHADSSAPMNQAGGAGNQLREAPHARPDRAGVTSNLVTLNPPDQGGNIDVTGMAARPGTPDQAGRSTAGEESQAGPEGNE